MDDFTYDKLKKKIFLDRGFDLDKYGQDYVKRRLNARMMVLNIKRDDWASYLKVIEHNIVEYVPLFDAFSVNVTEFFRDITVWQSLRDTFFPQVIAERRQYRPASLRIWSAACSSGEEPYTIAIILKEILPADVTLSIIATDIDDDALQKAAHGVYYRESLKNLEKNYPGWFKKYFTMVSQPVDPAGAITNHTEKFQIADEIKRMVAFKRHNFLIDRAPSQMDIIFCRNVMIYLAAPVKDTIMDMFSNALAPHGMFVVGKSEIIFLGRGKDYFYPVDAREHIYRKDRRLVGQSVYPPVVERRKDADDQKKPV
ncbi:MAG: hypothetical protein A2219_03355 [Elusimicrobia bacterium RIFOXYA2_FULL_50_26]|nr:MAG: hypothetical protein A2219_03355 [Elusimicrobia bacterium RIFOXYA2_FULL_50_26]OGS22235.1 MAG: hypothetical protein A2314_01360 [Elusimicrobia bacterium RIFOXYB2_FULL_50_12]